MSWYVKVLCMFNVILLVVCAYLFLKDQTGSDPARTQSAVSHNKTNNDLTQKLNAMERQVHDLTNQLSALNSQLISGGTLNPTVEDGEGEQEVVAEPEVPFETIVLPPEEVVDKPNIDEALVADLKQEAKNYQAMLGRLRSVNPNNQNKPGETENKLVKPKAEPPSS